MLLYYDINIFRAAKVRIIIQYSKRLVCFFCIFCRFCLCCTRNKRFPCRKRDIHLPNISILVNNSRNGHYGVRTLPMTDKVRLPLYVLHHKRDILRAGNLVRSAELERSFLKRYAVVIFCFRFTRRGIKMGNWCYGGEYAHGNTGEVFQDNVRRK